MINALKGRDSILEGILDRIQSDPVLNKEMIIHGGGALHFFYSSPRYSSDIDVLCPNLELCKKDIETRLMQPIQKDGKIYAARVKKSEIRYIRVGYSESHDNALTGNLEIDYHAAPDKCRKSEGKYAPIIVEEPSAIYADKVIATLGRMAERGSIKGSDLFDFNYIEEVLKQVPSDDEVVQRAEAFSFYGWNEHTMNEVIRFITDKGRHDEFVATMRKSMSPDFFETQNFNSEYFEKTAEHFARYLPAVRGERKAEQPEMFT